MTNFLKKLLGGENKLSEQEELIKNIFTKLIDMPNTNKVLVNSSCSYLSNSEMDVNAVIDDCNVIIEHGDKSLSFRCRLNYIELLDDIINNSVNRNSLPRFYNA